MKKIFSTLLVLFSFFFIINVKAFTFDYDNYNISDTDLNNIVLVRNYLNDNTTKSYNIIKVSNGYEVIFFNTNSSNVGNWYLISDKSSTNYYFVQYGYGVLDSNNKIPQNNYSGMIQDRSSSSSQPPVLPFNATETQLNTYLTSLDDVINSSYYGSSVIFYNRFYRTDITVDSNNNIGYPLYSSFDLPLVSRNTSGMSFNTSSIIYNEETTELNSLDLFIPYINLITSDTTLPPTFNDFGDGQYGFTTNSIIINDINTDVPEVNCPKDTSFINDFCYTNFGNYSTDESLLNAQLIIRFNLMNNVPYRTGDYYVLTIRFDSPTLYIPTSASISSGNVSIPISIVKTNVINNGIYKDLQIVLHTDQQLSSEQVNLSSIGLLFPTLSPYNPDPLSWQYGLFKTYKFSAVGNTLPDNQILDDDYNTNTLDGIKKSDKSWFDKFNINDRGLSSFVTSPIRLFQAMRNSTCSDVELPVPHFGNIKLPCISSIFSSNLPELFSIYQIIMSGIICYYVGLNYFRIIKNAFNPEDDRIEVQDL